MSWSLPEGTAVLPGHDCCPAPQGNWSEKADDIVVRFFKLSKYCTGLKNPVLSCFVILSKMSYNTKLYCVILCVFVHVLHILMFIQVGESNRPSFRPGLEGGSSDDESSSGRVGPSLSGIEHRRSAEGQVINPPVTGAIRSLNNFSTLKYFFDFLKDLIGFTFFLCVST